jgi:Protein of unknown function (DUF3619)
MNEAEIVKKITGYLERGTAGLKAGTVYRLQLARENALAQFADPKRASELALAGAGGGTLGGRRPLLADTRLWIGVLLMVGGVLYYQYWQSMQQVRELEQLDAAILSSDLPIEAYLDRGFQTWLKHSEP